MLRSISAKPNFVQIGAKNSFSSETVLDISCFRACLLSVSHSCLINILPWNEFLFEEGSAADVFDDLS